MKRKLLIIFEDLLDSISFLTKIYSGLKLLKCIQFYRGCGFDDDCLPEQWCVNTKEKKKGFKCVHKSKNCKVIY